MGTLLFNNTSLITSSSVEKDLQTLHHRDFYKGKSFKYNNSWEKDTHYFNDEYIIDFITFDNVVFACKKSHLATESNKPIVDWSDADNPTIDSEYWEIALVSKSIQSENTDYELLTKKSEYLYEIYYRDIDYNAIDNSVPTTGACSVLSIDRFVGRNYDWLDGYTAIFTVHTPKSDKYNEVYEKNTAPLIDFYENQNKLKKINGDGPTAKDVFANLEKLLF